MTKDQQNEAIISRLFELLINPETPADKLREIGQMMAYAISLRDSRTVARMEKDKGLRGRLEVAA